METIPAQPGIARKWYEIWWDVWRHPGSEAFRRMLQEPDAKAERGFKWVAVVALIEAMVLSLVGGLIGVFFGWGAARLMGQIQYSGLTITPVVGLDSILLATLFSMAIGLFFGIYPATRAARLQPVEALRYE